MLLVGIILKNVPYNFGQFGRSECTPDGHNTTFGDSIHDYDPIDEHSSFKRSIPDYVLEVMKVQPVVKTRYERSVSVSDDVSGGNVSDHDCRPKYIGHELDPYIARQLRTLCLTVLTMLAFNGCEFTAPSNSLYKGKLIRSIQ